MSDYSDRTVALVTKHLNLATHPAAHNRIAELEDCAKSILDAKDILDVRDVVSYLDLFYMLGWTDRQRKMKDVN
jgi:hypothetical protein